jgi:DNA-binding protein H-NS
MAAINVDKMSLKELIALDEKIQGALVQARKKAHGDVKQKLSELAGEHGFSISELFGGGRGVGKQKSVSAPKYANPDDKSDTWTGRGRKPNWLVARLKKGAKLDDFKI